MCHAHDGCVSHSPHKLCHVPPKQPFLDVKYTVARPARGEGQHSTSPGTPRYADDNSPGEHIKTPRGEGAGETKRSDDSDRDELDDDSLRLEASEYNSIAKVLVTCHAPRFLCVPSALLAIQQFADKAVSIASSQQHPVRKPCHVWECVSRACCV